MFWVTPALNEMRARLADTVNINPIPDSRLLPTNLQYIEECCSESHHFTSLKKRMSGFLTKLDTVVEGLSRISESNHKPLPKQKIIAGDVLVHFGTASSKFKNCRLLAHKSLPHLVASYDKQRMLSVHS